MHEKLIHNLGLEPHPEGGYFREVYRSTDHVAREHLPQGYDGDRSLATSILFLLKSGQYSCLHRLKSDELWCFHHGSPIHIHLIASDGTYRKHILGDFSAELPVFQCSIPKNHWFAASVVEQ